MRFCGLILLACLSSASAAPLPEVLSRVLRTHPDIQTSQALLQVAREAVIQQRSNYYPTLGLSAVAGNGLDMESVAGGVVGAVGRSTRTTDATLRWNLFHGRADWKAVRSAEDDRSAAQADLAGVHEDVALDVTEAYLDLLRLQRMMKVGVAYIADQRRLDEVVGKRAQAGRLPTADIDQVQVSLIQAEQAQSRLQFQLQAAEQRYRLLVGSDPGELTEPALVAAPVGKTLAALMDAVASGNGRVRADLARAAARGEDIGVAGADLYPSLDLSLTRRLQSSISPASITDTRHNDQLQMSYQLPLGGSSFSRKRQAEARREGARATAESTLLRARTDLGQRWETWSQTRAIAPRLKERLLASNKVVRAYDLQFESGRRSLFDLLSARGERFQAENDVIDNQMQGLDASARVLNLTGQLGATLLGEADGADCIPCGGREDAIRMAP